ncbi:hypothetical protein [Psychrobacillus sp. OK032]|uniref:hypothetical protein n=1 Tax=Psychrobacillus sp. OK032 TaxID=1884358 RepID=UPI0008C00F99|nr:hypothetical protein [Psychrobacillus sp. OK032]SER85825.1 hypothetical protein SAMN05518872_102358 [Psychrobacillus sp. OK032]
MLFTISIVASLIIVMLLILLIPIPYEKKPLIIGVGISGLALLFSYITTQTLSIWLGILFFIGILLSTAILVGKKREWFINEKQLEPVPTRSFHKIIKQMENPNARTIFEEEKSPLYIKPAPILPETIIPQIDDTNEEMQLSHQLEAEAKVDPNTKSLNEKVIEVVGLDLVIPPIQKVGNMELITPEFEYDNLSGDVAATNMDYPHETIEKIVKEKPKPKPILLDDSEELSDEWLSRRLDALFENEKSEEQTAMHIDEEEPEKSDLENLPITFDEPGRKEIDMEFEDLSSIYFNKQRSDVNGTKE